MKHMSFNYAHVPHTSESQLLLAPSCPPCSHSWLASCPPCLRSLLASCASSGACPTLTLIYSPCDACHSRPRPRNPCLRVASTPMFCVFEVLATLLGDSTSTFFLPLAFQVFGSVCDSFSILHVIRDNNAK